MNKISHFNFGYNILSLITNCLTTHFLDSDKAYFCLNFIEEMANIIELSILTVMLLMCSDWGKY